MTALDSEGRPALWHADAEAQRRDVRVVLGETSLTIRDTQGRALSHWALAAVSRSGADDGPAFFAPEGGEEFLEVTDPALIDALSEVIATARRARPRSGLVRWALIGAGTLAVLGGLALWAPGAIRAQAMATVPEVTRLGLGEALRLRLQPFTSAACAEPFGQSALDALTTRLPGAPEVYVMRDGLRGPVVLPGGAILMPAGVIADHDGPAVLAGAIIAAQVASADGAAFERFLADIGPLSTARLLATGRVEDAALDAHAEALLRRPTPAPATEPLLAAFRAAEVPSTPFAYARDTSGEGTLGLIEGDPFDGVTPRPLLSDGDWLALRGICDL
ncbi:MAG: hypothetical protein ACU0CI_09155 [Shimia sp.]